MTKKLENALQEQKQQTELVNQSITGILGMPLNGQRRVEVAGRNGFVYVRLRSNQSETIQAFNNTVAPAYNLPVLVKRQGGRYVVVGVDSQRYENNWSSQSPFLPRHGNTHSFDPESGGGGDIVWVYPRQIMPSLVIPSGSTGGDSVIVCSYTLQNGDGTWRHIGNTGTASFSPYLPTGSQDAIMVLVYLDTISGNPMLLVNSGTIFSNSITGSIQIPPYIPTVTSPTTQIPLAAVRLITGTSAISWNNIYDVRQWVHTTPTGTGGVPPNTYVPYTGATQNVNLGGKNFTATGTTTLAETNISEGSDLQIGSSSAKPTTSKIVFGDGKYVEIFEKYDDSLAIGVYGNGDEIFRAGYNQAYDNLEFILGDLQGFFHGLYLSICYSGTVVGSVSAPENNVFIDPSGTVFSAGIALIKEAPMNGQVYGRRSGTWVALP